jgi:hypothetical protein
MWRRDASDDRPEPARRSSTTCAIGRHHSDGRTSCAVTEDLSLGSAAEVGTRKRPPTDTAGAEAAHFWRNARKDRKRGRTSQESIPFDTTVAEQGKSPLTETARANRLATTSPKASSAGTAEKQVTSKEIVPSPPGGQRNPVTQGDVLITRRRRPRGADSPDC